MFSKELWRELTAGLNKPPLIRKKTQALTANEKPNASAIYSNCDGVDCAGVPVLTPVP